jgi:hypothetical protein
MRDAIDYRSSIQTFRKEARSAPGLDHVIEAGLRERPAHALRQIGVEDAEITAELDAIIGEEKTLKKFEEEIPKFPIPTIDTRGMRP